MLVQGLLLREMTNWKRVGPSRSCFKLRNHGPNHDENQLQGPAIFTVKRTCHDFRMANILVVEHPGKSWKCLPKNPWIPLLKVQGTFGAQKTRCSYGHGGPGRRSELEGLEREHARVFMEQISLYWRLPPRCCCGVLPVLLVFAKSGASWGTAKERQIVPIVYIMYCIYFQYTYLIVYI